MLGIFLVSEGNAPLLLSLADVFLVCTLVGQDRIYIRPEAFGSNAGPGYI
jgi:hypothetical protein